MATLADKTLNDGLTRFQHERAQARRFHPHSLGKEVDPQWCLGDFLCRVYDQDARGLEKTYQSSYRPDQQKTALSATFGGLTGGYLVPDELRYELLIAISERAIFRSRATVLPMKTLTLEVPVPDTSGVTAAGASPFFGDFMVSFAQEATTRAESEPTFRQVTLTAKELSAYLLISNPMLDDGAQALEAYLRGLIAAAVAWKEDISFLTGNGLGAPQGIISAAGSQLVTRNLANKFQYIDAARMIQNCVTFDNALWMATKAAAQEVVTLIDGAGRSSWVPNTGYTQENWHWGTLYGSPLYLTEKLPTLGTKGDVVLFAPALYLIGDRQEVTIDVSREQSTAFLNNQSVWRVLERIDGQPMVGTTISTQNNQQTVSPYVVLN